MADHSVLFFRVLSFLIFLQMSLTSPVLNRESNYLHNKGKTIVVSFRNSSASSVIDSISRLPFATRTDKINALVSALKLNSASSQKEAVDYLRSKSIHDFSSFWITNTLVIHHATSRTIIDLASIPSVTTIREAVTAKLVRNGAKPIQTSTRPQPRNASSNQPSLSELQWGLEKLNAKEFWDFGYNGRGLVVANIDSGVRASHRILRNNILPGFGWFDSVQQTINPQDDFGHGTHSLGVLVGGEGYGVAPGARWISCRACLENECLEEDLLACGQFVLCPTDPSGREEDCSKSPNVVSNSWSVDISESNARSFYDDVIAAWHVAKIIPIFSVGDNGPSCESIGSPGHHEKVITVGATNSEDVLAPFSSIGPTSSDGRVKPDIVAPGEEIWSASHTGDDDFASRSGTGAACSHIGGAALLYLSQMPFTNYNLVSGDLKLNAVKTNLVGPGLNCGNVNETVFPNNAFGHGRAFINVYYIPEPTDAGPWS